MTRIDEIKKWWNDWHEISDSDFDWLTSNIDDKQLTLRKALWTIQKLADELNLDYDQVNDLCHNVMDEISCELEKLK